MSMRHAMLACLLFLCCRARVPQGSAPLREVQAVVRRFVPVTLGHDLSRLPVSEVETLQRLVQAARYADRIFLRQVDEANPELLTRLEKLKGSERVYLDFFRIMYGPWDRLEGDRPLIGNRPKPTGAAFYPTDLTREEWEAWLNAYPEDREDFESNYTVIRRRADGLVAIPYATYYAEELKPMAGLLKEAASLTQDPTLAHFLASRAEALLTNDYVQSEMDWMDLSGDIEFVIGPYEVYEDALLGYKAAFESFVCLVDHEESDRQKRIVGYLDALEKALPYSDSNPYPHARRGPESPMKVVHLLYSAGDTRAGVQTSAFNLPNDERVRAAKGSKKVMLKNVMQAKFEHCWIPIVSRVLAEKDFKRVSFDAYFYHVVMHEVSHGLGPGQIRVDGKETTVNKALKELYATIEEAKADVLGVYTCHLLVEWGVLPREIGESLYASNLGGMFRSIRFGIDEAHGGGVAIQLNYYLETGACRVDAEGRFSVDEEKMAIETRRLAARLLDIEARGDYQAARNLIQTYRHLRPEVKQALERLTDVPIDIRPIYPVETMWSFSLSL